MRIVLAAVGRARKDPTRALYDAYARRIAWPLELREVEEKRPLPTETRLRREGELLSAAVPKGAVIVALDERGAALSSAAFAARMGRWRDDGASAIAFLIGGADGLDPALAARVDLVLGLGPMTWPHLLVRALLAEQIYRAQQILAGHPYHRE